MNAFSTSISALVLALLAMAMPGPALGAGPSPADAAEPSAPTRAQVVADLIAWRESRMQLLTRSEDIDFGRGPAYAQALARYRELKTLATGTALARMDAGQPGAAAITKSATAGR